MLKAVLAIAGFNLEGSISLGKEFKALTLRFFLIIGELIDHSAATARLIRRMIKTLLLHFLTELCPSGNSLR